MITIATTIVFATTARTTIDLNVTAGTDDELAAHAQVTCYFFRSFYFYYDLTDMPVNIYFRSIQKDYATKRMG
jgi:hypothetical protein